MTLDPRAEMTLEQSRVTQEPSAADRERNLAALRERLGLPAPPAANGGAAATNELPRASELPAPRAADASRVASGKLVHFAAVAAVAAALGYFAGSRSFAPPISPMRAQPAALPPAPMATPTLAERESDASRDDTGALRAAVERGTSVDNAGAVAKNNEVRAADASERHAPAVKRARATEDTSMQHAVSLLRRARSALSKGEPLLALALLDELDERFPRTPLDEERDATRVLALCANGQTTDAETLSRQLIARHPRSIYAPRIAQSCAAKAVTPGAK